MTPGQLDRFGDRLDIEDIADEPRPHRCRNGFQGEDDQGRPIPCVICRAELAQRIRDQRERWSE